MKYGNWIKGLALGTTIAMGSFGQASAALVVTFDPTGAGLTPTAPNVAPFQSDTQNGLDTALAVIDNATGNFTENGILRYDVFDLGANIEASGVNSEYQMYLSFSGSGVLPGFNPANPAGASGHFTSITWNLFGAPSNNVNTLTLAGQNTLPTVNGIPPAGVPAGDVLLASGAGINTANVGINASLVPNASVNLKMTQAGTDFFLAPPGLNTFIASFINSSGTQFIFPSATTTQVVIAQGSFNGDFAVNTPEPASLIALGSGLLGLAGVVRRRRKG